jgi:hypothetical protein
MAILSTFKMVVESKNLWVGFILLLIAFIGLASLTPWMGLIGDNWWFFSHLNEGTFLETQLKENPSRPLVAYFWSMIWTVFGLNIPAYYIINSFIQWISAFVLFLMLRRFFLWSHTAAFVAAALFLLYPSDTARVYLATLSTRVATLFAICGAFLWLYSFMKQYKNRILNLLGLIFMLVALLAYETFFILFALLPLMLAKLRWLGPRTWIRQSAALYIMVLCYLAFRIWIAIQISIQQTHYYTSIILTPEWFGSQLSATPSATIWKGWLYLFKVFIDFSPMVSITLVFAVTPLLLFVIVWLQRRDQDNGFNIRDSIKIIGFGAILVTAAILPVAISNFSIPHAVGSLDGRLLHNASLGHAFIIVGFVSLSSGIATNKQTQITIRNSIYATLLSIALIGSIGVQRLYAQSWSSQLRIIDSLHEHVPSFLDNSAIVLLDVPSGPYNIKFYNTYTQLTRMYYSNQTLHVIPMLKYVPTDIQMTAFGQESVIVLTDIPKRITQEFKYGSVAGFVVNSSENLRVINHIGLGYLCKASCLVSYLVPPDNWTPATEPVAIQSIDRFISLEMPQESEWRKYLLQEISFNKQYPLP